jgi:hypothetical protein
VTIPFLATSREAASIDAAAASSSLALSLIQFSDSGRNNRKIENKRKDKKASIG